MSGISCNDDWALVTIGMRVFVFDVIFVHFADVLFVEPADDFANSGYLKINTIQLIIIYDKFQYSTIHFTASL